MEKPVDFEKNKENAIGIEGVPFELIRNVPGGFHICQSSREKGFPLVYMSQRFLDILGWTKKEIAERFNNKYIRLVYPADWRSGIRYKSDKDEAYHMQGDNVFRMLGKDGYHWVSGTAKEVEMNGHKYIVGNIFDINNDVQREEKLKRDLQAREAELQKANAKLAQVMMDQEAQLEEIRALNEELMEANIKWHDANMEQEAQLEEVRALNDELEAKQRKIDEQAYEQEMRDVRELTHAARWTAKFNDQQKIVEPWASDELRHILGYGDEEEFPNTIDLIDKSIHPEDLLAARKAFATAIEGEKDSLFDCQYRVKHKNGTYIWVRGAAKFRRDITGAVRSCIGIFVDVNDYMMAERKHQQELETAWQKAELANKAKTEFLHGMSHDMRTPLNGIMGLIKINEAHHDNEALVRQNHKKMEIAAKHLLSLIDDVLQTSRLESGKIEIGHELVNMGNIINEVASIIEDRAREFGIKLSQEVPELTCPYVYSSQLYLRQILLNIYGNCIRYNHLGGSISTSIKSWIEGGNKVVYQWDIRDTGIGMSQEFIQHIFEPFSQEKKGARTTYQGTGLGMSIVKKLLEQMGGNIAVTSEEGKGSNFLITLPLEIAPAPQQEVEKVEECYDIQGIRILLAEDNALNAEIAKTLLEDAGAVLTVVADGRQAVESFVAEPESFDVIILDLMMPVMGGLAAAKKIRGLDSSIAKNIPIVAMTANAFKEDVQQCLEAGMNAHVAKPLDMARLRQVLCQLVRSDEDAE